MARSKSLSMATKLYLIVGVLGALITLEMFALQFSLNKFGVVRLLLENQTALVGEISWFERVTTAIVFPIVLIFTVLAVICHMHVVRNLVFRLNTLSRAAEMLGHGDFSYRIKGEVEDEIGQFAYSINRMASTLEHFYRDLEGVVAVRTKELTDLALDNENLYKKTKKALNERDDFLSIASHELKTPLTALILQLQMALRAENKKPDQGQSALVEKSLTQASKLADLIEQLLDLTRIHSGQFSLQVEPSDFSAIVLEGIQQFQIEARRMGITLSLTGDTQILGNWDPLRLTQVISNLLTNALKYGGQKPIEIHVSHHSGNAILQVRDHGEGIAKESLPTIFDRFERVKNPIARPGLGLGLYITKQIVEAHGGSIKVKSEVGVGTTFTVSLPLNNYNKKADDRFLETSPRLAPPEML